MDLLLRVKNVLSPLVGGAGLRRLASTVYRCLLRVRYFRDPIAQIRQNGRLWRMHYEVGLRGEEQEMDTIQWLRSVVKPGDCCIDVGANVGQMTLEAAALCGPSGRVVAIEPSAGNLRLLRRHVEVNGMGERIDVVGAACCASHGAVAALLVVGDGPNAIGSGHALIDRAQSLRPSGAAIVDVPTVSIDGLCHERRIAPNAIKVDVEGAELEVVSGAMETLRRCRPKVRVAFHPFAFSDPREATEKLRSMFRMCGYDTAEPGPSGSYALDEYEAWPSGGY